jgi:hypothetical protein
MHNVQHRNPCAAHTRTRTRIGTASLASLPVLPFAHGQVLVAESSDDATLPLVNYTDVSQLIAGNDLVQGAVCVWCVCMVFVGWVSG